MVIKKKATIYSFVKYNHLRPITAELIECEIPQQNINVFSLTTVVPISSNCCLIGAFPTGKFSENS